MYQHINRKSPRRVSDKLAELEDSRVKEWRKVADELLLTMCTFRDISRDLLDRFTEDLTINEFERWSSAAYDLAHEVFLARWGRYGRLQTRIDKALQHMRSTRQYWIDFARKLPYHGTEIHLSFQEVNECLKVIDAKLRLLAGN